MRSLIVFLSIALCVAFLPVAAIADSPHDTTSGVECMNCHMDHPDIPNEAGFPVVAEHRSMLCQSCHTLGAYGAQSPGAVPDSETARPFSVGRHHAFDCPVNNLRHGSEAPEDTAVLHQLETRVDPPGEQLISCTNCHNQHRQTKLPFDPAATGARRHYMRVDNQNSQLCLTCHSTRDQSFSDVETYDGTFKTHPVGQGMGANGAGYDRSLPLDGNRRPQTLGEHSRAEGDVDGNASNNLVLNADATVGCLTCHRIHRGESNTLTKP